MTKVEFSGRSVMSKGMSDTKEDKDIYDEHRHWHY